MAAADAARVLASSSRVATAGRAAMLKWSHRVTIASLDELALNLITPRSPLYHAKPEDVPFEHLPYWAFLWPGGYAVSRYVMEKGAGRDAVRGKRVLDFGAGCGVCGLAALASGATHVVANDIDALSLEAVAVNAEAAGSTALRASDVDERMYASSDMDDAFDADERVSATDLRVSNNAVVVLEQRNLVGVTCSSVPEDRRSSWSIEDVDTILVGDMTYDEDATDDALVWLTELARLPTRSGAQRTILIGDPGRTFIGEHPLADRLTHVARYALPPEVLEANSGYTHGDVFTLAWSA